MNQLRTMRHDQAKRIQYGIGVGEALEFLSHSLVRELRGGDGRPDALDGTDVGSEWNWPDRRFTTG